MSRIERLREQANDVILDILARPFGMRRRREGNKVIYTRKRREPIRTERIETETEVQYIDHYGPDESSQVDAEDIK